MLRLLFTRDKSCNFIYNTTFFISFTVDVSATAAAVAETSTVKEMIKVVL